MQGMLVSDTNTKVAGASISVGIGSFAEPDNLNGLAHFLEHLLILYGNNKYGYGGVLN